MLTIIQKILGDKTPQDKIDHQPHCSDHDDINVSQCLLKLLKEKARYQSTHLTLQEEADKLEWVNQLLDQHEMDVNVEDNGCSLIIHAIQNQHANEAIEILRHTKGQCVKLDYQDHQEGNTPLLWAMKCHQWGVVAQILHLPLFLDSQSHETWSWADARCDDSRADKNRQGGIAQENQDQHAMPDVTRQAGISGNNLSIQKIHQRQEWINMLNNYAETALTYACCLLTPNRPWDQQSKADEYATDNNKNSERLNKQEQRELIKHIVEHPGFQFSENRQGQKALEAAIAVNREDIVAILLDAAVIKHWEWLSMYTSTHADANTSLIRGLGFRYTDITKMLVDTDMKFKLVFKANVCDSLGQNLLHHTALAADMHVLKSLLAKSTPGVWSTAVNQLDNDAMRPIDYAIENKEWEMVNFLLDKGAKITRECFGKLIDEANDRNDSDFVTGLMMKSQNIIQAPVHGMMGHIFSEKSLLSEYQWTLSAIAVIFAVASAISANQRNAEGGSHLTPS